MIYLSIIFLPPPILTFLFILLCYSNPSPLFILFVPHASPSSMVLWPSCGPRCLWPADMSRLHSTVLHSAPSLFPCPLFPLPFFGPLPRCSLLLSLKSVTPHCLFILFGTLSSFHLLFLLLLLPGKVGMSCLMLLAFIYF